MTETTPETEVSASKYLTNMLNDFEAADMAILESHLALNSEAWTIDKNHARKHGAVVVVDFRNTTRPEVKVLHGAVGAYLEDPYRYYMLRYSRLPVEDQRKIMLMAMIPLDTATERQIEIFDTVATTIDALFAKVLGEAATLIDLQRATAEAVQEIEANGN